MDPLTEIEAIQRLALAMVVGSLRSPAAIMPLLQDMGRRHIAYGVRPEHYATVGEALLWALEQAQGEDFTPETSAAWAAAYDLVASAMLEPTSRASRVDLAA